MVDADQIPQPDWSDVFDAYAMGAADAKANPECSLRDCRKAADAYCKFLLLKKSPEVFDSMGRHPVIPLTPMTSSED